MRRFAGMTFPVANFLAENVFCILDDPTDDSQRIDARAFGVWIRDLPTLLGSSQLSTHIYAHSLVPSTAPALASRRPIFRQASLAGSSPCRPPVVLRIISQSTVDHVLDHDRPDGTLSPALELVLNEDENEEQQQEQQAEHGVWSLSTAKRRKRGRKGKGMTSLTDHTQTSERLALASKTLVSELSHQISAYNQSFLDAPPAQPVSLSSTVTNKQSRWKLSFKKSGGEATIGTRSDSRSAHSNSTSGLARATNITNLIMGVNPATPTTPQSQPLPVPSLHLQSTLRDRARGRPDLLSMSQQRRGVSPTSTGSGRPLASISSCSTYPSFTHCHEEAE